MHRRWHDDGLIGAHGAPTFRSTLRKSQLILFAAMLLTIPDLLSAEQLRHCRSQLDAADWVDGRATAGFQGSLVKHNQQLAEDAPAALALGDLIVAALERHPLFISAVLPLHVYPPLFNRYEGGQQFGEH